MEGTPMNLEPRSQEVDPAEMQISFVREKSDRKHFFAQRLDRLQREVGEEKLIFRLDDPAGIQVIYHPSIAERVKAALEGANVVEYPK